MRRLLWKCTESFHWTCLSFLSSPPNRSHRHIHTFFGHVTPLTQIGHTQPFFGHITHFFPIGVMSLILLRQWLTSLNIFSSSSLNRQIDGQTPFFGHITHFFPIGVVSFILLRQSHSQPRYQIILRTQTGQQFHMFRAIWQHLWSIESFTNRISVGERTPSLLMS